MTEHNQPTDADGAPDLGSLEQLLGGLSFEPAWVRQSTHGRYDHVDGSDSGHRTGKRPRRERGERPSKDADRRDARPRPRTAPSAASPERRREHDASRRPPRYRDRTSGGTGAPPVAPAPVHITFLPTQTRLRAAVRQLAHARKAYPVGALVEILFAEPAHCDARLEVHGDRESPVQLYQCQLCKAVTLSEESLAGHFVAAHIDAYFDRHEETGEPPKGQFNMVARCGMTGRLLGPPNHHSYALRVQEILRLQFPTMPREEYERRIRMERDPALVEQWKTEQSVQITYRRKDDPEPKALSLMEADAICRRELVPLHCTRTRRAVLPASMVLESADPALARSAQGAWRSEVNEPRSRLFALRGAFRAMKLHLFRCRHMLLVSAIAPSPLATPHVDPVAAQALDLIAASEGCTRQDVIERARQAGTVAEHLPAQIDWLVDRGHVIELPNGQLFPAPGTKRPAAPANRDLPQPTEPAAEPPADDTTQA